MSTVSGVGSSTSSSSSSSSSNSTGALSQSDFYQIITAQLQQQDPENATDPNEMVQDLMSLSTYQASLQESQSVTSLQNYSMATSLLGKTVDISVPATTGAAAQTVSGVVSEAQFTNAATDGASVTVNGNNYNLQYVTDAQ